MSGYIGNIPVPQATQTRDVFTATAGQTSFATSGYTPNFLDVFLNGVHLLNGTDYTATNGSDVVLTTGAAASDVVEVISYSTYEVNAQTYTGGLTVNNDGATVLTVDRATSDGSIVDFKKSGTTVGSIGAVGGQPYFINSSNKGIRPYTNGVAAAGSAGAFEDAAQDLGASSVRWRNLYLSGGVYLGGTGAANLLDDYEEGTFTPTLSGYTGVTGTLEGKYVKIGQMVFCHISMSITALTYSGNSRITGWPFTPSNTINNHVPHGTIGTGTALNVDPHLYHMAFYNQTTNMYLYNRNTGSPLSGNNYQVGILGINVVYQAS